MGFFFLHVFKKKRVYNTDNILISSSKIVYNSIMLGFQYLLPTRKPSPEARLTRRQSIEPYENRRKILNFCVTDFFPYLAPSNTPYLGSDVTLLAFVPRLDLEPACSLLTIQNQCVLSSLRNQKSLTRQSGKTIFLDPFVEYIH